MSGRSHALGGITPLLFQGEESIRTMKMCPFRMPELQAEGLLTEPQCSALQLYLDC